MVSPVKIYTWTKVFQRDGIRNPRIMDAIPRSVLLEDRSFARRNTFFAAFWVRRWSFWSLRIFLMDSSDQDSALKFDDKNAFDLV